MSDATYPEIERLRNIHKKYRIRISVFPDQYLANLDYYPAVECIILDQSFSLFVDDEYEDFQIGNPFLSLCLVLRELENYHESSDYLIWSRENNLDASDEQVRGYYMSLSATFRGIEKLIGKVDSQISDYDFGLNAGAARALRNLLF